MKLLFDQNLSPRLVDALADIYPGSMHVRQLRLEGADDVTVWHVAAALDYTIVSKDSDFRQRSFVFGAPPRVIWVNLGSASTAEIQSLLRDRIDEITAFHNDPEASFLVLQ